MYTLINLNVVKIVAGERDRDALLAKGYKLYVEQEEEPAAAPAETVVEAAPETETEELDAPEAAPAEKPRRVPMKTKKR